MKRSYDAIAGLYDRLAAIFIGKALRDAQVYLVQYIPAGAKVLIVGGGTGWILEEINKLHTESLQIDYIDVSAAMIVKAKLRNVGQHAVNFFHQSATDNFDGYEYDVLLTPFFFDNFKEVTMRVVFNKLHQKLKPGGIWLYADFQVASNNQLFQKSMLWMMYTFFRAACNIEANTLPDVDGAFKDYHYYLINSSTFKNNFIVGKVYRKVI